MAAPRTIEWVRSRHFDSRLAPQTPTSATRKTAAPKLKPVPEAAISAVGDTLKEQGLAAPATGGGTTFLQAKTAHEVLKAQERRIRLQKLKGELIDRGRALALRPTLRLGRALRFAQPPMRIRGKDIRGGCKELVQPMPVRGRQHLVALPELLQALGGMRNRLLAGCREVGRGAGLRRHDCNR